MYWLPQIHESHAVDTYEEDWTGYQICTNCKNLEVEEQSTHACVMGRKFHHSYVKWLQIPIHTMDRLHDKVINKQFCNSI